MKVISISEIGTKRTENQDRVSAFVFDDGAACAVICDGMGGENAGSEASSTAISIITDVLKRGYASCRNTDDIFDLMNSAILAANDYVYSISLKNPKKTGMGTTCVMAIVNGSGAYFANVGDSRAYILSDNSLQQISVDHSIVQSMIDGGEITAEEALRHPKRNLITRAVGVVKDVTVDFFTEQLSDGMSVMLCSDGLCGYCGEEDIRSLLCSGKISEETLTELKNLARSEGSTDDTTIAAIITD